MRDSGLTTGGLIVVVPIILLIGYIVTSGGGIERVTGASERYLRALWSSVFSWVSALV